MLRSYATSDQRVHEMPCTDFHGFTEILWPNIEWEPQQPETAKFRCPHCQALIAETHKPAMVAVGDGTRRAFPATGRGGAPASSA